MEDPGLLDLERPGLLTNFAAVAADRRRGLDALVAAGIPPHCVIAPEHGYWGTEQAGEGGSESRDAVTGIPVISSYQVHDQELVDLIAGSGVDGVLVDLQDVGCRFYTYPWSMADVMAACSRLGLPVHVLDRPAPLPSGPLGPGLDEEHCASFVGRINIPLRHGARLGDLAHHLVEHHLESPLDLTVTAAPGEDGDAPWVPPSPNLPTLSALALYPGTGLVEGTTWSEGRGTTLPFEVLGAPWADHRLAGMLREADLPGIQVRETAFRATHGDFAGQRLHGVQLHLEEDAADFVRRLDVDPIRLGMSVLRIMRSLHEEGDFWRRNAPDRPPFIDLLWGSPALREGIEDGADDEQILAASPTPLVPERTPVAPERTAP